LYLWKGGKGETQMGLIVFLIFLYGLWMLAGWWGIGILLVLCLLVQAGI
jgi:hypothetical protein